MRADRAEHVEGEMMERRDWSRLRVGVLGLGRSGRAATRLLAAAGARVYASDVADSEELHRHARELVGTGADVDLGRHDEDRLAGCDLLVVSPGIPPSAPVFASPGVRGKEVISELELAFDFLEAPVIAITGTNGKTTTTAWTGSLLRAAGIKVGVGGNIGLALSELAAERGGGYEWIVAEVSSFQLANIERFKPAVGILLNLCPDHLDRYADLDRYYADKARLFDNADESSNWVLNGEDEEVRRLIDHRPGTRFYFRTGSGLSAGEEGAYLDGQRLVMRWQGREIALVERTELRLLGAHNVANALAAALAARCAGAPLEAIRIGLREFEPLPHRLQPVLEAAGILWINDSKATNVASTRVALSAMDRPVVLLLGGKAKGESFAGLLAELRGRAKAVIAYGQAAPQIERELADRVSLLRVDGGFEEVVRTAARIAESGDVVLLAPACASFDMFRDYEERGERFMELVRREAT